MQASTPTSADATATSAGPDAAPVPDGDDLDAVVVGIGERIRALRQKNELTLQDLAERTSLSLSMLSTVERGRTTASLGTLHAIARALGVQITTLFAQSGADDSPIVEFRDQIRDVTDGGLHRRTAAYRADLGIEVYVDDFDPHTSHARTPSQHPGDEIGVVLEGELELQLGGEIFSAAAGDVAQFSARRAHLVSNVSDRPARAVWINLRRL
ncbi:XRE family transcriptional regulator [Curtobacterium citreum]|uniref:Cupin domain-containing protein n=1 Tax=Curtobacterium citreum TaxID=2036 RepID=A0ABT2HH39_9MICO|nr:cupin domain-containing protein [Curtobacterium citreum]MCS6522582.1 cupin domain-containing protein [Curtobacterium citreum]TQJ26332.1 XRE family transcriptional regulator [Curtobacterium citreum]GGL79566.1 XRE family transcriptional regulator [Curtobacterium citreum]